MAKSIYEILADLTTNTSVPGFGDEIEHTIPANLFPDDKTFEDKEALLEWAEENNFTHALLQKGIQKGLIDARATFKSCKKSDNWSPEYGQKNVDSMEWTITKRPGQTNDKAKILAAKLEAGINMARAMISAGIDESMILASLTPVYGDEGAQAIMTAIK
jgi:hypothetical protein